MLTLAVLAARLGAERAGVSLRSESVLYAFPPIVIVMLYLRGLYRGRLRLMILDGIGPVVGAISLGAMIVIAGAAFAGSEGDAGPLVARAWFFANLYVGGGRILLALTQRRARARDVVGRPTLIVGAGHVGAQIARRLEEQPDYGLRVAGYLDADPPPDLEHERRASVLGTPDDLAEVARRNGIRHVILAFSNEADRRLVQLVRECDELGLEVSVVPRLFESINDRIELEHVGGLPLFGMRTVDPKGWQFAVKHGVDRGLAALGLLVSAPLLLATALAVKLSSPGPVLYRQLRIGRDGREFELLKFRSMRPGASEPSEYFELPAGSAPGGVEGVDRRTPLGRFMRRTSLDELPQLLNVLRGDMSLIGPRPERPEFVELFRDDVHRYSDRHRVKSGITGWAQVHGLRGQTSLTDRVEWDNFYIENWSLWLDVKILLLTVGAVLRSGE